jgi:CDP-glucose 4,6-dehydratase
VEDVVTAGTVAHARAGVVDAAFWRGRKVLITGHTGFIGGWTAAWLHALGAEVSGIALEPATAPSLFDLTGLATRMHSVIADIRSIEALDGIYLSARPDVVLHLAAQPLVRVGYERPVETFAVNLMGTVNVLDCVRRHGADAVVVMTSDKVYADREGDVRHAEHDRLGAAEAYGGSKACCELAAEAYGQSYLGPARVGIATVRAGNVLGGGDWQPDRLVPDAIRAFSSGVSLSLRRPEAVRPWQHVLDAASGLLLVAQEAVRRRAPIGAWNIGPPAAQAVTVETLAERIAEAWGLGARFVCGGAGFPERQFLSVDASRAWQQLAFHSPWTLDEIVERTVTWYRDALAGKEAWTLTMDQIDAYHSSATLSLPHASP